MSGQTRPFRGSNLIYTRSTATGQRPALESVIIRSETRFEIKWGNDVEFNL